MFPKLPGRLAHRLSLAGSVKIVEPYVRGPSHNMDPCLPTNGIISAIQRNICNSIPVSIDQIQEIHP